MLNLNRAEVISELKTNKYLNVFLVASPILAIITRMIIESLNLDKENILIISLRDTSLEILPYNFLDIKPGNFDRYIEKVFFDSPTGRKIQKYTDKYNKQFIIYCGWAYREVNWLLRSPKCAGHIYIEEGQGSFFNYVPYSRNKMSLFDKIKFNISNRENPNDGEGFFFRDDALLYIGMSKGIYPKTDKTKKYILNNLNEIKKYYKPKLLGITQIGLTCSASRLPTYKDWEVMMQKLIKVLPYGSFIKPHPSFTCSTKVFNKFKLIFDNINNKNIKLLHSNINLELEMLYEKKNITGPQSSLHLYTLTFGSTYQKINLF